MSLDTGRSQLYSALKTLRERWDESKVHWNDSVRASFEENEWAELEPRVVKTLAAIDKLSQVIHRAKRDCS